MSQAYPPIFTEVALMLNSHLIECGTPIMDQLQAMGQKGGDRFAAFELGAAIFFQERILSPLAEDDAERSLSGFLAYFATDKYEGSGDVVLRMV